MGRSLVEGSGNPGDLRLKQGDPRGQFIARIAVQNFAGKLACSIAAPNGTVIVIHYAATLDALRLLSTVRIQLRVYWVKSSNQNVTGNAMTPALPATTPMTMTAVGFAAPGGPEVLRPETLPVPVPGPGEVLIKVSFAGVNRPDVMQRMGSYPPPPGASPIPGLEIAGVVAALGEGVSTDLAGRKVCALVNGGGYAEDCLAKAAHCLTVPPGLPLEGHQPDHPSLL